MLEEVSRLVFQKRTRKEAYSYQERILHSIKPKLVVNKARQTGISTIAALKGLMEALSGRTVLIISPSLRQSKHMMDYIQEFLVCIKSWELSIDGQQAVIDVPVKEETKTSIMFQNGGQIYSLPNSASTVRGYAADLVICDEFAHFLNGTDKEVWEAILPSLSRGGQVIVISTPFGENNLFHKFWTEDNSWDKLLIPWNECPDLDIEPIKASLDDASFKQEYCNAFLGEMDSYFPYELIKKSIDPELPVDDPMVHLLGIDFGRKYDLTAIIGLRRLYGISTADIKAYEVRLVQTARAMPFDRQLSMIRKLLDNREVSHCVLDAGGMGMPLAEQLKKEYSSKVQSLSFTLELKQELMTGLKRLMEQGKLRMPNHQPLINSLHAIRLKQTESKHFVFDSPRDEEIGHSDAAWGLAMAVRGEVKRRAAHAIM